MPRARLSAAEARRIALAAQGFAEPRRADGRAIRRLFDRVALVQIDSVNVLSRAHYLPGFARLGAYDREALDKAAHYAPRRLFEYWGHEASLIDVELQPLLRWRMERAHDEAWGGMRRIAKEKPHLLEDVLDQIRERGPLAARDLDGQRPRKSGPWWDWSDSKRAIEMLFWGGEVTSRPPPQLRAPLRPARARAPARGARRAHSERGGRPARARRDRRALARRRRAARAARLLPPARRRDPAARGRAGGGGELHPVEVESWTVPAWLHRDARLPRRVQACALLGPFDNLLWERGRVERLFGFRFKLEIYVPQPKRVYGYYVLPFLLGDRLVARVDLKADRRAGRLLAHAVAPRARRAAGDRGRAGRSSTRLAGWLGLTPAVP